MLRQMWASVRVVLPFVLLLVLPVAGLHAQQAIVDRPRRRFLRRGPAGCRRDRVNLDTGIKTAVVTNAEGHYTIPLLPPGRYSDYG